MRTAKLSGDLSKDDFEVLEDGVPPRISFFARSLDVPLSLASIADVSASQRRFNEGHLHDMKEFLTDVPTPRDQAFLSALAVAYNWPAILQRPAKA
jgi:Ca-activated chloride channel family protein